MEPMTPKNIFAESPKSPADSAIATAVANWEPRTVGVTPAERLTSGGNQYNVNILGNDRRSDLVDDTNS